MVEFFTLGDAAGDRRTGLVAYPSIIYYVEPFKRVFKAWRA